MSYFIATPTNSHDSALTLVTFVTFLTASQDSQSHSFLENIFLKWNATLLNKNGYSISNNLLVLPWGRSHAKHKPLVLAHATMSHKCRNVSAALTMENLVETPLQINLAKNCPSVYIVQKFFYKRNRISLSDNRFVCMPHMYTNPDYTITLRYNNQRRIQPVGPSGTSSIISACSNLSNFLSTFSHRPNGILHTGWARGFTVSSTWSLSS